VVFAVLILVDTMVFLSGRMPLQGIVVQGVCVLASVGVVAYAFSRRLRRRWVWRQIWWIFPLSELIVYVTEQAAVERLLSALRGGHATNTIQATALFVPLASLALYRLSRSRLLT